MHLINVIENISGYFWLLLFPLVRGFFTFRGGLWSWLNGVWFDLMILAIIFGLAFLRWWMARYELMPEGVHIISGIMIKKNFVVPYRQFATISLVAPFYYRPFKVGHLYVDSDAGNAWKYDFALTLSYREAEEIFYRAVAHGTGISDQGRRTYRSSGLYIALLAFISSKTFTGMVYTATLLIQAGKVVGHEFETAFLHGLTDLANQLAFGIPPAAVFLALVVILGWGISFLINLSKNYRFTVTRKEGQLQFYSGIFTRYRHRLNIKKVNLVESRQSIFTKIFHIHSLFIHCSGYGKAKNELSVLFPAANEKRMDEILKKMMPEWKFTPRQIFPSGRSIFRFILAPIGLGLVVGAAAFVFSYFFSEMSELIVFLGVMFELPVLWWMIARVMSFFHTGVSEDGNVYTLYFLKGFGFHTVVVQKEKIVKVKIRQSFWQGFSGVCTVFIYTWSEGKKRHVIPALPIEPIYDLFHIQPFSDEKYL